jgi:hypothetical protein
MNLLLEATMIVPAQELGMNSHITPWLNPLFWCPYGRFPKEAPNRLSRKTRTFQALTSVTESRAR